MLLFARQVLEIEAETCQTLLDLTPVLRCSDAPPSQLRKLVKTHDFEYVAYAVEELGKDLVSRKHDNGTQ